MLFSLIVSLIVAAILIQVTVFAPTIYLHRCRDTQGARASSRRRLLLPLSALDDHRAFDARMGGRPPQTSRVYRSGRQSAQPASHGFWSVQLGNVFHYIKEAHDPETLDATRAISRTAGGIVTCSGSAPGSGSRHERSVSCLGSGGHLFRLPAVHLSCTCSCCPHPSTVCAITSATATSTTPRPTSGSSRC